MPDDEGEYPYDMVDDVGDAEPVRIGEPLGPPAVNWDKINAELAAHREQYPTTYGLVDRIDPDVEAGLDANFDIESHDLTEQIDAVTHLTGHLMAIRRFGDLCMGIMGLLADGGQDVVGTLFDILELVADTMDACDHVDEESQALYGRAYRRITEIGMEPGR